MVTGLVAKKLQFTQRITMTTNTKNGYETFIEDLSMNDNSHTEPLALDIEGFALKYKVQGVIIVFNDANLGAVTKFYYYNNKSYMAKKFAFNPGALTELLILSKHTEIIQGIYKSKGLIKTFKMKDDFGRETLGYIFMEVSSRASIRKLSKIMEKLAQKIEQDFQNGTNDFKKLKEKIERTLNAL